VSVGLPILSEPEALVVDGNTAQRRLFDGGAVVGGITPA
jgi:hypothetical protein